MQVTYILPNSPQSFKNDFINYLSPLGKNNPDGITLELSDRSFVPITNFLFEEIKTPQVAFLFDDGTEHRIDIKNITGKSKTSPHKYSYITISDFIKRILPFRLRYVDHTGCNLPYFNGIHPTILDLREKLKKTSLYHTFPKHLENAPWDFILPATKNEINNSSEIDYSAIRRPKIEIVSFEKSSTPLIQIDMQLDGKYEELQKLFPEAIPVPQIKSLWVYIINEFGIDICFVLNEASNKDWSFHFAKERLT